MRIVRKKLSQISSVELEEITSFLKANFCTIFHEVDLNKIVSEVFGTEFSYVFAYNRDGKLIALCTLHSIKDGILMETYSNPAIYDIRYGGWIYDRNEVFLPELIDLLKPLRNESMIYWSVPQVDNNDYLPVKHKVKFQTPIIDLTLSLDDILHKYILRKRRQTIKSASRKGVIVEELNLDNLNIFIEQCKYLKQSVGLNPLPADLFIKLFKRFYPVGKIAAFASKLDNNYLASGMIIGNEKVIHLWVAGKPKKILEGVPRQDLLIWETIKWAKKNGCHYYDLCYIDREKQPDIARHKLGFSKNIVPFYFIVKKNLSFRIISKLRRCF